VKIKPIVLCGGAGTRLFPSSFKNDPKQFMDFGGWTLFQKTLERIQDPIYDFPVISSNAKYEKIIKKLLKQYKIKKYNLVLEPFKKNTAAAVVSSALLKNIPPEQPLIFLPADQLIDNKKKFNSAVKSNAKKLTSDNICIFGIKPLEPSNQFGYFLTSGSKNKVVKFIEKPKEALAKKIIKKNAYWNSGIFYMRKDSLINHYKQYQPVLFRNCLNSVERSKSNNFVTNLNKASYKKAKEISFDYAILEKSKNILGVKLNILWSDLGSWRAITNLFQRIKKKYYKKKNTFIKPWGKYFNLHRGQGFLIKELVVNQNSSISLQKHRHRSEHWTITQGQPKVTIDNKKIYPKLNETVFIPLGAIHRVENNYKQDVKIIEAQVGKILKESDIIRYVDQYGRIK
jgi:mannose-1-phosphate guanylyltransferase